MLLCGDAGFPGGWWFMMVAVLFCLRVWILGELCILFVVLDLFVLLGLGFGVCVGLGLVLGVF